MLREMYLDLRRIFEELVLQPLKMRGYVFTGLGEGRYYVSLPGYFKPLTRILGAPPYPGTLNLRLADKESIMIRKTLETLPGIVIPSFRNEKRSYGAVKCFRAIIANSIKGLILLIERTHHNQDVIELVATCNLRKVLRLKDGDLLEVIVEINQK